MCVELTKKNPAAATTTVMMALKTKSHFHPGTPCRPSSVSCIDTCMKETNMEEAGYDVPNIAIRVASSDGVLVVRRG